MPLASTGIHCNIENLSRVRLAEILDTIPGVIFLPLGEIKIANKGAVTLYRDVHFVSLPVNKTDGNQWAVDIAELEIFSVKFFRSFGWLVAV